MKIVSEKQLTLIRTEYQHLIDKQSNNYFFEGVNKSIFDNLVLFTDDIVYNKIRDNHYLAMTNCQRTWNKYFWYLRYQTDILKNGGNIENHQQPISKILEELYQTCDNIDDSSIEPFVNFASKFDQQEYVTFDYFHPAITETGVSLLSKELNEIIKLLQIENFNFEEIDALIVKNIDDKKAELLTFKNHTDKHSFIKIDTFTAGEDQIHPIAILIRCKTEYKEQVDDLLVSWWSKFWKKLGPFVAITTVDKFETNAFYTERKRINK
ncbi:hypothetical protein [Flavobacterium sp.]|uniref:hypothetical protein n=1 Tax=Flavobacterium sp. TaxID=239 RepID=UPI002B6D45A6|nr:hypothetical protein [Flavobacterium sp.]HSD07627.1 hypothetical protein [Flavobacterium sp.]